jgi:hypothetical protein
MATRASSGFGKNAPSATRQHTEPHLHPAMRRATGEGVQPETSPIVLVDAFRSRMPPSPNE